jgi:hypothetical protein
MNNRKPLVLSVLASSIILLTACGGSDTKSPPAPSSAETYTVGTHPRFNPVVSDIPFNTDIIFAKAAVSDGTADLGVPTDAVRQAVNQMDGFSTSAYFDVLIDGSVDATTAVANQSVFLVELDTGAKDALVPANIVGVKGVAKFDVVVTSLDGQANNAIRIRPLEPLSAKSKYLVILTNDIKDSAGKALTRSWSYNALREADYAASSALLPLRSSILAWESLGGKFLSTMSGGGLSEVAAKEKIVLSYTFTTTDSLAPLVAMASPRAALLSQMLGKGLPMQEASQNINGLDAAGLLSTPSARAHGFSPHTGVDFNNFSSSLAANVGKLYTGFIKLPYYLSAPTQTNISQYITKNWQPDLTLAGMLGVTVPADVDGSYNVTYRYPFAAPQSVQSVPLQITLPNESWVPGYAGASDCSQIYSSTGYPTVIYVHGITSDRSSVVALAHTLASRCIATVAIDLPLHGVPANSAFVNVLNTEQSKLIPFSTLYGDDAPHERHFNVAGSAGNPQPMNFAAPTAADGSGAQFINLGYLANTRDGNRQAVMDLLNLNASLGAISATLNDEDLIGFDTTNLYVVGVSLGGILSGTFTTVNQLAMNNDAQAQFPATLNPIQGLVMSAAGTQVAQVLVNSPTFAPVIIGGLAQSGVMNNTTNFERFLYAAQTLLDSADPVNFAPVLGALRIPTLIQQINGDVVIPNSAASAPLTGTQALARLMEAEQIGLGETNLAGAAGLVQLSGGGHSSLLRPEGNAPEVTAELQTQVVTFILNNGRVVVGGGAPALVDVPTN